MLRPKQNAIGTPASTSAPTPSTKNSTQVDAAERPQRRRPSTTARRRSRRPAPAHPGWSPACVVVSRCSSAKTSMSPAPIGSAAARHTSGMSSAGEVMYTCSAAYSKPGCSISSMKAPPATVATASRKARGPGAERAHDRGHPHVHGPAGRDHGAQHRQPQEQGRRQLVAPDQRRVEHEAGDDAEQQDRDLDRDQGAGRRLDHAAQKAAQPVPARGTGGGAAARVRCDHVSLPVDFSSRAQASSPYLPFHSS